MNETKNEIGQVVSIAEQEFIVLDHFGHSVLCLSKNLVYQNTKFDLRTNNYAESDIRHKLNTEYLDKILQSVPRAHIYDTEIDLTSDDGLDDYGKVLDPVGLLTADMYRKYNRIIEKYPVNAWWWLATPWSTPHRGYSRTVRCVCDFGSLNYYYCFIEYGVRPFLIFSSSILYIKGIYQ